MDSKTENAIISRNNADDSNAVRRDQKRRTALGYCSASLGTIIACDAASQLQYSGLLAEIRYLRSVVDHALLGADEPASESLRPVFGEIERQHPSK